MLDRIRRSRGTKGQAGFTLIELLVVIVILGILSAVVVFAVGGIGDRGQASACTMDERTLRTAGEAHYARHGSYGATPGNWNGSGQATPTQVSESSYVSGGFLSEESQYHDIEVADSDAGAGITPSFRVVPQAGSACT